MQISAKIIVSITFIVLLALVLLGTSTQRPTFSAQNVATGFSAITLDASCTNSGTTNYLACSSAMTVTAGDTIVCNIAGQSGGSSLTGDVIDAINGPYNGVFGTALAGTANPSWVMTTVFENSAGGSITPIAYYKTAPSTRSTINCKAWKNTATSYVLDGGGVEQTTGASVINPTSGTATAPLNNNSVVWAVMSRNSATAPSSGGGAWLPSGTLTVIGGSGMRQSDEYQIQTTAATANGPFTGNTTAQNTVDSQLAVLPLGTTGGYRGLTGFYLPLGAAGSAPTGTVTAATLGGATSYLTDIAQFSGSPFWTVGGTPTYDTGVNPTATGHIMVAQVAHAFGDAGSSVKYTQAATGSSQVQDDWFDHGEGDWLWSFWRISGTGIVNNDFCDILDDKGGVTSIEVTAQMKYNTNDVGFILESTDGAVVSGSQRISLGNLVNTDLRVGMHIASVNERYHVLKIQQKSGGVWSDAFTLQYDNLCTQSSQTNCTTPTPAATPTGTNSSGSTAMTLSSGTGTVNGQVLIDPTNSCLPWPTRIDSGGGTTSITLSQPSTCAVSGTTVNFYSKPVELSTATNGTVSAGSTAVTIVVPTTGTVTVGQSIGGFGIRPGTIVSAVAGTSLTLSIPASAAMTNGGLSFWNASGTTRIINFGRFASCNTPADQWWSGLLEDEAANGAFNSPN
jgi:hypothetical protein